MNLTPSEASIFAGSITQSLPSLVRTSVWMAPSLLSLPGVVNAIKGSPIDVGGQNSHWEISGAFTGETSPKALKDIGATFVILGHSERRALFGETSETVAKRMRAALSCNLTPVICIGETEDERQENQTEQVLTHQLAPIFEDLSDEDFSKIILAYEPVWAIGTGNVASQDEIKTTHDFVHKLCSEAGFSTIPTVLYGGSVNPSNAEAILSLDPVGGALVGGASIKKEQWMELIRISESLHSVDY